MYVRTHHELAVWLPNVALNMLRNITTEKVHDQNTKCNNSNNNNNNNNSMDRFYRQSIASSQYISLSVSSPSKMSQHPRAGRQADRQAWSLLIIWREFCPLDFYFPISTIIWNTLSCIDICHCIPMRFKLWHWTPFRLDPAWSPIAIVQRKTRHATIHFSFFFLLQSALDETHVARFFWLLRTTAKLQLHT